MNEKKYCPHCGQAMMIHKHCFSKAMASIFIKIARKYSQGDAFNLNDFGFTTNEYNNFQKLRYFGLVDKYFWNGKRKGNLWYLTPMATNFLGGGYIHKWVQTFNNKVVVTSSCDEKGTIRLLDANGEPYVYRKPLDYAKDAVAVENNTTSQTFLKGII